MQKTISLVVSVYNEEEVLGKFFSELCQMPQNDNWNYEVIFVNDGSTDRSMEILENLCHTSKILTRIISFSRNFGHEAAMLAGIDYSTGDCIVCLDADLQHPLTCIPDIIAQFEQGYEVINMVRISNKSAGIVKNITSALFYRVVNWMSSETALETNASDFFAISKKVATILRENYREKNRFLRGYIQNVGFKRAVIHYVAAQRAGGKSHYSLRKLFKFSVNTILCFSDMPLRLGIYVGIFSAILGLIVLLYTLFTYHTAPNGYATIVVLICFLFAALFFIVGIIGEYIAILFAEVKDRPIYIIDKKINFVDRGLEDNSIFTGANCSKEEWGKC